ncbi:MAG: hypothetical protein ACQESE_02715 [Nanobdellota archaeon]
MSPIISNELYDFSVGCFTFGARMTKGDFSSDDGTRVNVSYRVISLFTSDELLDVPILNPRSTKSHFFKRYLSKNSFLDKAYGMSGAIDSFIENASDGLSQEIESGSRVLGKFPSLFSEREVSPFVLKSLGDIFRQPIDMYAKRSLDKKIDRLSGVVDCVQSVRSDFDDYVNNLLGFLETNPYVSEEKVKTIAMNYLAVSDLLDAFSTTVEDYKADHDSVSTLIKEYYSK